MKNNQGPAGRQAGIAPLIVVLIVAGILAVGGGVYYAVKKLGTPAVQPGISQNQTTTQPTQSEAFSDFGISFTYPKELSGVKYSFGWNGEKDSGYRINFGINDTPGATGRMHAFSLRYPCDNCTMSVGSDESSSDATVNGYQFKKITSLPKNNPYYPNLGYIEYFYKDSIKNIVLYEFHFDYGGFQNYFANYDIAKVTSEKIMGSIKISEYDHSNVYRVFSNQPPVISSFKGPTAIGVNQTGSWKVEVADPENDKLRYVVRWDDEPSPRDVVYPFNWPAVGSATEYSTSTFTHTYKKMGTYTATVFVVDNDINHITSKTMIVRVGS